MTANSERDNGRRKSETNVDKVYGSNLTPEIDGPYMKPTESDD